MENMTRAPQNVVLMKPFVGSVAVLCPPLCFRILRSTVEGVVKLSGSSAVVDRKGTQGKDFVAPRNATNDPDAIPVSLDTGRSTAPLLEAAGRLIEL
jgi:hypothetical protein